MNDRKKDHIDLAFDSQIDQRRLDERFYYEPLFSGHPSARPVFNLELVGKQLRSPFWVSSMTGGTEKAGAINRNLARACAKYKMGMGLGSCRILLEHPEYFPDFDMRPILGDEAAFFANIGIAQLEEVLRNQQINQWLDLIGKLQADGLIIHVNPWQEWMQPEGDHISVPPLEAITQFLDHFPLPVIVKEVGQGMGKSSLDALLRLPIAAIDFAANGGTNFTLVELLRSDQARREVFEGLTKIGHSAEEMVDLTNELRTTNAGLYPKKTLIISGGIKGFLDGYYLHEKSQFPALIGQASALLKRALISYEELDQYLDYQHRGWALCQNYLVLKTD
ncbi:MAG TPA: hypothetical protein VKZ54_13490 [Membranihabitans sp.]|nr:hypothetical protein [Membranihabitans sp.]